MVDDQIKSDVDSYIRPMSNTTVRNTVLGVGVILGAAYLMRMQLEREDVQRRENRPQDFFHGVDISQKFTAGTEQERTIYSRLQAYARLESNPLDRNDFGIKYKQAITDWKAGKLTWLK